MANKLQHKTFRKGSIIGNSDSTIILQILSHKGRQDRKIYKILFLRNDKHNVWRVGQIIEVNMYTLQRYTIQKDTQDIQTLRLLYGK